MLHKKKKKKVKSILQAIALDVLQNGIMKTYKIKLHQYIVYAAMSPKG